MVPAVQNIQSFIGMGVFFKHKNAEKGENAYKKTTKYNIILKKGSWLGKKRNPGVYTFPPLSSGHFPSFLPQNPSRAWFNY